jgi:hypothetical protein
MHRLLYLPAVVLLFAAAATAADAEKTAVETIEKLGGKIFRDDKADGKPIVQVDLHNSKVKAEHLKQLRAFKQLRKLELGFTDIGDEGLKELHELKSLREVGIGYVHVSNEAVAALKKALPECKIHGP